MVRWFGFVTYLGRLGRQWSQGGSHPPTCRFLGRYQYDVCLSKYWNIIYQFSYCNIEMLEPNYEQGHKPTRYR
jgi:hypothetical protein